MAEYCPNCPNRGECDGEIEQVGSMEVYVQAFRGSSYPIGSYAVAFSKSGASRPMAVNTADAWYGNTLFDNTLFSIDNCQAPSKSWALARKPTICHAFENERPDYSSTAASFALPEDELVRKIAKQLGRE